MFEGKISQQKYCPLKKLFKIFQKELESKVYLLNAQQQEPEDVEISCWISKYKSQIYLSFAGLLIVIVIVFIFFVALGGLNDNS